MSLVNLFLNYLFICLLIKVLIYLFLKVSSKNVAEKMGIRIVTRNANFCTSNENIWLENLFSFSKRSATVSNIWEVQKENKVKNVRRKENKFLRNANLYQRNGTLCLILGILATVWYWDIHCVIYSLSISPDPKISYY